MGDQVPEALRLAESLANSLDVETGADDFDSPSKAVAWLAAHGLGDHRVTNADLVRLQAFRSGLRAILAVNHGEEADPEAVRGFNDVAKNARLTVQFDHLGAPVLEACGSGIDRALAEIVRGVAAAIGDGTWRRLKICRNDTCAVAFYDQSKNRSRSWCSMSVCGNRMKVRTFRAKKSRNA